MRVSPLFFLLLPALVSACAEDPFVDHGTVPNVQKPTDPVLGTGAFTICHGGQTPAQQVTALAEEQCGAWGLTVRQGLTERWQCRASAPHRTTFRCVDPNMRDAKGEYINPLDREAVTAWEKQTGQTAPLRNRLNALMGTLPPSAAPAAAPAPASPIPQTPPQPPVPPAPAIPDLGNTPAPSVPARPEAQPLPPEPPRGDGFSMPMGSWGDHFQD